MYKGKKKINNLKHIVELVEMMAFEHMLATTTEREFTPHYYYFINNNRKLLFSIYLFFICNHFQKCN